MPQRCRIPQVKSPHASGSATASTSPAARVPADVCGNAPRRRPSAHVIARPMATTGWGSQRGSPKARSAANPAATARIVITGHRPPKRGERREGSAHPRWRPMRRPARYARRNIPFSGQLARRAALSRYPRERRRRHAPLPWARSNSHASRNAATTRRVKSLLPSPCGQRVSHQEFTQAR